MRFHLIDRIEEIRYNDYIIGVKCVTLADDVFNEHFPGYPVFPGSLILEGLAQLSGSFFELIMKKENKPIKHCILSIVNKLKFRRPVFPGDKTIMRADIVDMKEDYGVAKVRAEIDGKTCAEGELTFVFMEIKDKNLYDSRIDLYNICMKNTKILP